MILDTGTNGANCQNFGTLTDNGYNLSDDASCGFTGTGSANNATLNLSALTGSGPGGGVHTPQAGSNAIGAIPNGINIDNNGVALACDGTTTDQLGNTRPITSGADCTSGAVEVDTTVAVTLGWFLAQRNGDVVEVRWQTATETGTAGFHVLAATDDGNTVRLNQELIPSPVIDSITPTDYAFTAVTDATLFYLDEVGVDGGVTRHGPFELGMDYGAYSLPGNVEVRPAVFLPVVAR